MLNPTRVPGWPSRSLLGRPLTSSGGAMIGILVDVLVDAERACADGLVVRDDRGGAERVIPYARLEPCAGRGLVLGAKTAADQHGCDHEASRMKISRLRNRRVLTHRG